MAGGDSDLIELVTDVPVRELHRISVVYLGLNLLCVFHEDDIDGAAGGEG